VRVRVGGEGGGIGDRHGGGEGIEVKGVWRCTDEGGVIDVGNVGGGKSDATGEEDGFLGSEWAWMDDE
jgi:hypothetical protein